MAHRRPMQAVPEAPDLAPGARMRCTSPFGISRVLPGQNGARVELMPHIARNVAGLKPRRLPALSNNSARTAGPTFTVWS